MDSFPKRPAEHSMHDGSPGGANFPFGQVKHPELPAVAANFPALQGRQNALPVSSLYDPGTHD